METENRDGIEIIHIDEDRLTAIRMIAESNRDLAKALNSPVQVTISNCVINGCNPGIHVRGEKSEQKTVVQRYNWDGSTDIGPEETE